MRIRHVACIAPPRLGGIGNAALRQVMALCERGHDAELIVPDVPGAHASEYVRPWPVASFWGNAATLKRASDLFVDTDVVHLHYPFYGTVESLLWNPPPVPVVLQFHMDAIATDWRELIFAAHRRWLQPRLLRHAARIIVSSRDYAERSSIADFCAAHPERVREIPFFLDMDRYTPASVRTTAHELRCLFVGALDAAHGFKGLPLILEALAQTPWATLALVGDGNRRKRMEQEVQQCGFAERVHFLGRLSDEELVSAYQNADVLLFPSTSKAEAFGLVALEAQACGTPVIASALPGVRQVVLHEQTGLCIEPNSVRALVEAMKRMQDHLEERLAFGAAAREHVVRRFAKPVVMEALEVVYREVCVSRS